MVKFPQELVDAIIDQLYQDRRALLACLSVSSFFRCRAQFHLFLSIPLAKEGDFEEFSLLCATSPSIPNLVKTLRVTLPESAISLPRLPYVHTLHLNGSLRVMSKDLGTFRRKFSWLPNTLTSLSIQNITFSSIETFRSLLGALPLLRSLSLLTVAAITTRSNNSHLLEPSRDDKGPPIEVLSITSINSDGVCAFFHGHPHLRPFALHRLRELHFFGFVVEQVTDIQRLLNESRDSLREFHLRPTFYYPSSRSSDKQILDISHVPIITLRLRGNLLSASWGLEWLLTCLEKGSYPLRVEQINIIVDNLFTTSSWTKMDKALCDDPRFSAIQVMIALGGHISRETMVDKSVISAMPGLYSEGRVRVEYEAEKGAL